MGKASSLFVLLSPSARASVAARRDMPCRHLPHALGPAARYSRRTPASATSCLLWPRASHGAMSSLTARLHARRSHRRAAMRRRPWAPASATTTSQASVEAQRHRQRSAAATTSRATVATRMRDDSIMHLHCSGAALLRWRRRQVVFRRKMDEARTG